MNLFLSRKYYQLVLFSIFISVVTYGYTLTNFSLTIDSELPTDASFSLALGRWAGNLVRYHLFNGLLPYFTLLIGLLSWSITSVELTRIFKLNNTHAYIFCALFLTIPQMAYQFAFTMQADYVPFGILLSVLAFRTFLKSTDDMFSLRSILFFSLAAFMLMFVIAFYQALIFSVIMCYLIHFMQTTYEDDFTVKKAFIKAAHFGVLLIAAALLYFISVKVICPPVEEGYLSSYTNGDSSNLFGNFIKLWKKNLLGLAYYGERTFVLALLLGIGIIVQSIMERKQVLLRILSIILILLAPFLISFFITSGYNPPRIYIGTGFAFAFIAVHFIRNMKAMNIIIPICLVICLAQIYFITNLFYASSKIFMHDKEVAQRIDGVIRQKYPDFDPAADYVYFHGRLPDADYQKMQLPDSEIFSGSHFFWDNGSNYRIICFFAYNNIAYYKMLDNKEAYAKAEGSIAAMPTWPKPESIQKVDHVIIVKLGNDKGSPLPFE